MRVPEQLVPLVEQGIIQEVIRPLMSGKEAQVYLVISEGEERVAKVYKTATNRSFKHRSEYTEGRKVRNSRQQRAMNKRSKYGRSQIESEWRNTEVDAFYRLRDAGVLIPEPYDYVDGVLIMELVSDHAGQPAPRLVDVNLDPEHGMEVFNILLREVVKMLCAGIVHGDLSDFNVLMGKDGPVIIDFPQVVDPASNRGARKMLIRDVENITNFLARFAPELKKKRFAVEMWDLYERGELTPETRLTGKPPKKKKADTMSLLEEIADIEREHRKRREALGLPPPKYKRKPVVYEEIPIEEPAGDKKKRRRKRKKKGQEPAPTQPRSDAGRARKPRAAPKRKSFDPFDDLDALLSLED